MGLLYGRRLERRDAGGRRLLDDRVGATQVVPLAVGTHLDVVRRELTLPTSNPVHVFICDDAPTTSGQPWAKHVEHFDQRVRVADRATLSDGNPTVDCVSHELGLGVAHL